MLLLLLAAGLVLRLGQHGAFSALAAASLPAASPLPGATVESDPLDAVPVVTSLRSNGEAERQGVRVGDRIAAIDGRPVADLAALHAALARHARALPFALDLQRGTAVWSVALASGGPPPRPWHPASPGHGHDPQDSAR